MKKQVYLTPAEGKRLIAKAISENECVLKAAKEHTLVILAGTTNGYIAEELLKKLGLGDFDKSGFFRGIFKGSKGAHLQSNASEVLIRKGQLITGRMINDIEPELELGDMIMKGGNAVYLPDKEVGVVIGNDRFGTLDPISVAYYGRRVQVLLPVGLEKRVEQPIHQLAAFVNAPDCSGTRYAEAPGQAFTELDALEMCGVKAILLGGGGVCGLEGSVLLGIEGDEASMAKADEWVRYAKGEPIFGE